MSWLKKSLLVGALASCATLAQAAEYTVDTKGAHAFVQFRVKHLGYSWLYGRFDNFSGDFSFDAKDPKKNKISIEVDVTSLDSNHEKRDLHIRSDDFLNTDKFPKASFVSTSYKPTGDSTADVTGELTMLGVTKPITVAVEHIGEGSDPWGGYRSGFQGSVTIKPEDWGLPMAKKLGPASAEVELIISLEGVRK